MKFTGLKLQALNKMFGKCVTLEGKIKNNNKKIKKRIFKPETNFYNPE